MPNPPAVAATVRTLEVPDARLHYEVLATDHTVLTTDPRGINRSPAADRDPDSTPELGADDLSRLLAHLDAGPAAVLGSSGGAVTALALAQAHPEQVHTGWSLRHRLERRLS
jgi:pimeloyl-ACP methyl ester carboxylesterase